MRQLPPKVIGRLCPVARFTKSTAGRIILAVVAGEIALVGWFYMRERTRLREDLRTNRVLHSYGGAHTWWPFDSAGVRRPPTVEVDKAAMKDDDEVLGVVVNGEARAYRLHVMRNVSEHVVNDVIDGVPVSVLYCDLSDCVRAFVGQPGAEPLPIRVAGMMDGEMIVKIDGALYRQRSGERMQGTSDPLQVDTTQPPIPFASHPFTRTTWKEWKQQHPKTDAFVGLPKGNQEDPDGGTEGASPKASEGANVGVSRR